MTSPVYPDRAETTDIEPEELDFARIPSLSLKARLRAFGNPVASAAASFAVAFVVVVLLSRCIPDAGDVIVSAGPIRVLVGTEINALAVSLVLSLFRVWHDRRLPIGYFVVMCLELNLVFAIERLI